MLVGAVGLAGLAAYPFVEVLARPRVTRYALKPPGWTDGLKLRICALADFHACEPWMNLSRIKSICAKANSLDADIVLLLGDYAAGTRLVSDYVNSADWSQALASLQAPLGVHAILGNHDYWEDLDRKTSRPVRCETRELRLMSTSRFGSRRMDDRSGLQVLAISWRCCRGRAMDDRLLSASMICTGRWRRCLTTPLFYSWRMNRIFSPACRTG